jgi:hypothetical protein
VLNVGMSKEFAAGHIPGALNIDFPAADFEAKVCQSWTKPWFTSYTAPPGDEARWCATK